MNRITTFLAVVMVMALTSLAHAQEPYLKGSLGDGSFTAGAGYVFYSGIGVEASYIDFGDLDDATEAEATSFAIVGTYTYDLSPGIGLTGRAGVNLWERDGSTGGNAGSEDSTDLTFGVDVSYQFAAYPVDVYLAFDNYPGLEESLVHVGTRVYLNTGQ